MTSFTHLILVLIALLGLSLPAHGRDSEESRSLFDQMVKESKQAHHQLKKEFMADESEEDQEWGDQPTEQVFHLENEMVGETDLYEDLVLF